MKSDDKMNETGWSNEWNWLVKCEGNWMTNWTKQDEKKMCIIKWKKLAYELNASGWSNEGNLMINWIKQNDQVNETGWKKEWNLNGKATETRWLTE